MRKQFYHPINEQHHALWSAAHDVTAPHANLQSVLPQLQALALRTHQWVTVIGAPREIIEQLVAAGISRSRIRWVYGRDQDEREWATEQALLAGTSSIVLSWLGDLSHRSEQRLKMASKVSQTYSFVFNPLPSLTPLH